MTIKAIGLGQSDAAIRVYVKNRPNLIQFQTLSDTLPLQAGQIAQINAEAGNGWRKVFNVYAKWLYQLAPSCLALKSVDTWQQFRDQTLLQNHSQTALLFSEPDVTDPDAALHVIAGKTHAKELAANEQLGINLIWLNDEFALSPTQRIIVCPYFDYRQLNNAKIDILCELIHTHIKL